MKSFKLFSFLLGCFLTLVLWLLVDFSQQDTVQLSTVDEGVALHMLISENINDEDIDSDQNIFFIESKKSVFHQLDPHQACSIEAAGKLAKVRILLIAQGNFLLARMNPLRKVYVLFLTKAGANHVRLKSSLLVESITNYENVRFKYLNIVDFSRNTPLESWLMTDKLGKSRYLISHTSDVLRFLTLWKFGGTYLDLDVIQVSQVDELTNYACAEDEDTINGAILSLDKGRGKEVAKYCIE